MKSRNRYRRADASPLEALIGREHSDFRERQHAEHASAMLLMATQSLFRRWEERHGFQDGAAQLLLPAGYSPESEAA